MWESLWKLGVLTYVALVLVPPLFLGMVVWIGPNQALSMIGLHSNIVTNPMRIEQRIGRVDRAKQQSKQISILNFRTLGTVEEYVQIVLMTKLRECRTVLGDFSSPLELEKVYEDKLTMGIGRALMEAMDADDMRRRMNRLGEDDLNRYVGNYLQYEKQTPSEWTWRPRD